MNTHCTPLLVVTIIFYCYIHPVTSLRCIRDCLFGPVSLGSTVPIHPSCQTIDIVTGNPKCVVEFTIDFETGLVSGNFSVGSRLLIDPLTSLKTLSTWTTAAMTGLITYSCATTDDCDQEFVRETLADDRWSQINATEVREEVNALLLGPPSSATELTCAHDRRCPLGQNCAGIFLEIKSPVRPNPPDIFNNLTCDDKMKSGPTFIHVVNTVKDREIIVLSIYCNKTNCNRNETVERVLDLMQKNFTFPLNYSTIQQEMTTASATTVFPVTMTTTRNNCNEFFSTKFGIFGLSFFSLFVIYFI